MNRFLFALVLLLVPFTSRPRRAPDRPLPTLIPARCSLYVEACGLQERLREGLQDPFVRTLLDSKVGRAWLRDRATPPAEALRAADTWLGTPVLPLALGLVEHGVALGVDVASDKAVAVAAGRDEAAVSLGLERLFGALTRSTGWPGSVERPAEHWSGADVWRIGEDAVIARRGALVVLGNDESLVRETLELAADDATRGLIGRAQFASPYAERAPAELWAWLDVESLEPEGDAGFHELREAHRSPAFLSLLGPGLAGLATSGAIAASASLRDDALLVTLSGQDSASPAALAPGARSGPVPPELPTREHLAQALVYRDLAALFVQRLELFPAEVQPGFAEAVTNGSLFFAGEDLCEDVLAHVSPWIRVVMGNPTFREGAVPELPLPGVVLVGVLEEDAGESWIGAFQTLVSVIGLDQAQKGQKGLRLHLERAGDVELSLARYPKPGAADGVDLRYNLEPAVTVVGRYLVVGTHASLVAEVAEDLMHSPPLETAPGIESLTLDGRALAAVLERNAEALISRKMLDEGIARERAAKEIEGLRLLLESIDEARLEVDGVQPTRPRLELRLELARAPEPSR